MKTSSAARNFKVGETVHLIVRVSEPGTKTPTDATVTVASLRRGDTVIPLDDPTFARVREGDYLKVLQTVGFDAGTYKVRVRVEDGPQAVVLADDQFVLTA